MARCITGSTMDDLIDLRSPLPGLPGVATSVDDFCFQPLAKPAPPVHSLIDDLLPPKDQPAGVWVPPSELKLRAASDTGSPAPGLWPGSPTRLPIVVRAGSAHSSPSKIERLNELLLPIDDEPDCSTAPSFEPQGPEQGEEQCESDSSGAVPPGQQASQSHQQEEGNRYNVMQLRKELEELRGKLCKLEASRDAVSRDLGNSKALVSKLEGTVKAYEKQLKQGSEDVVALRKRAEAAELAAAEAKLAAGVTPERCRQAAQSLHAEAQGAHALVAAREAELGGLQQLLEYEVREMRGLKDFMTQERCSLLDQCQSLQGALDGTKADYLQSQERCSRLEAELRAARLELQGSKREVWTLNNAAIEQRAEGAAVRGQLATAQAAAQAAAEELVAARSQCQAASADAKSIRAAGVKLYKQIRAVAHALEGHLHVFQPMPKVLLSIRSLQEWCAKQASFWGALAEAAAAEAAAGCPADSLPAQATTAQLPAASATPHPH